MRNLKLSETERRSITSAAYESFINDASLEDFFTCVEDIMIQKFAPYVNAVEVVAEEADESITSSIGMRLCKGLTI